MFGFGVGSAVEGSVEDGQDKMSFFILSLAVRTQGSD